jgi:DNA-binding response OmpR family regulator
MKNGIEDCGRRILLLHDLQETREAFELLLKRDGYLVYGASDESSAIDRARCHPPDLILISLGGAPQRALSEAQRIRSQAGLNPQTPIVVLSIPTVPEGAELHIGEDVYITFPDNFNQLRALLTRLMKADSNTG